ncbi:ribonuclease H-like domain-containing protein [Tanacetum coccineum]
MEAETTTTNLTARLPILKPTNYDLWLMRIEQYFLMTDYSLWEVIKNGNKVLKRTVGTVEKEYKPTTTGEKQDMRNEIKARATLLMTLPNKDQLKFHSYQDAKLLMEAIKKRYGGNKESKKVQRTLLKQQYENFTALSSETMDQTFDRLQKLISQLEIQGEVINQEDMNLKLLRSLPSEWKTHALIWRNKVEIETISLDDFTNSTNSTNKADNTTYEVSTAHIQEDLEQLHPDDLEEMDLQWEIAMLTIRTRRFIKRTGRKLDINGQRVGFDKSKVECYNCHKNGHFARECRFPRNQENKGRENNTRTITVETPTQNALIAQDGIGGYDWSYQAEEEQPTNYALMAFTSSGSSSSSDSEVDSCSKTCVKAYATLKEQYDSLSSDYKKSQFNLVSYKAGLESVEARLAHYKKNEAVFEESINVLKLEVRLRDNALDEYKMKLDKAEKERDQLKQTLEKFQNSSKSLNDLLLGYDATTAASPAVESFVNLTDKSRSDKGYHSVPPPLKGNFIPRKPYLTFMDEIVESENLDVITIVTPSNDKQFDNKGVSTQIKLNLMLSGKLSTAGVAVNTFRPVNIANTKVVNTVGSVNTVASKPMVNHPRTKTNAFKRGYSQSLRHFNRHFENKNSIINTNVNTARGNSQQKDTKKKELLTVVVLGTISGKGKIKTGSLDFDDLLDESQVLLRAPRKDNIYSADLKSVVPTGGLTCPIAKAIIDESNTWHRRLGHINFKIMNKLVKGNLDETSGILKTFITKIENQLDHKVKVIRSDNGTEFKNSIMNQFCEIKGIKREISMARTPQQNSVAERKNITLIEVARTMLVDSKLPATFWPEAVNTACYMLNRVLVIKPQNKTPYELIHGRPPLIDFMKPFGYPITILNIKDHLGKFDGKADEDILLGNGPDWIFDVDSLSISMNYVPVAAGNKTNGIAGNKDNIVADYEGDAGMKPTDVDENEVSYKSGKHDQGARSESERLNQREMQTEPTNSSNGINTVSTRVSIAGPSLDTAVPLIMDDLD